MLCKELEKTPYSKTDHRNRLMADLPLRNAGAVKEKTPNHLRRPFVFGLPHIRGYKPLDNYQTLLIESIDAHLERHPETLDRFVAHARRPLQVPMQRGLLFKAVTVDPPRLPQSASGKKQRLIRRSLKKYPFVTAEAQNPGLREAGERFVLDLERARLRGKALHAGRGGEACPRGVGHGGPLRHPVF